jgi:hypothetical protein
LAHDHFTAVDERNSITIVTLAQRTTAQHSTAQHDTVSVRQKHTTPWTSTPQHGKAWLFVRHEQLTAVNHGAAWRSALAQHTTAQHDATCHSTSTKVWLRPV